MTKKAGMYMLRKLALKDLHIGFNSGLRSRILEQFQTLRREDQNP